MKKDLTLLQKKVEKMLEGERKRREVAIAFLNQVTEILTPIGPDIWGNGVQAPEIPGSAIVTRIKEGKRESTDFYFRYETCYGDNSTEYPGFYRSEAGYLVWGDTLENLRGADFWYGIQVVVEWIPQLIEIMDKREKGREQLLALIKIQ